ncbi:MAG: phytanoyl-CoA dioxygenase family protein [Candidatus Omnitrophica bacterium]|nr:phytanoyl-CoA dioxygenase family protein [Candidatus Omnitrophota bacterium]
MHQQDTRFHPTSIGEEEFLFFHEKGFLVLKNVLQEEELQRLQQAMTHLMEEGLARSPKGEDCVYGRGHKSGRPVLHRIEYVIDKTEEGKVLLGHPFILRSVEKLIGRDLIPTWDSMVLKLPGEGMIVPWHRDDGTEHVGDSPIFNVDFYLDPADLDTCLWAHPGSHLWPDEKVAELVERPGFSNEGAIPILMEAGDVLFHNVLLLHGSPSNVSTKMRRVLYYEFRSANVEMELGPHVPEYIQLKQQVLLDCIERRKKADYVSGETPYAYKPPEPFAVEQPSPLNTHRFPHEEFWRSD